MIPAMYLSAKKTGLDETCYNAYSMWVRSRVEIPSYTLKDIEQMLPLMHHDKKNARGATRAVLLKEIGAAMIDVEISDNEIRDALLVTQRCSQE